MRPPEEEVIRKIVGEWVRKADQDIASARALLSQGPPTSLSVLFPFTASRREILEGLSHVAAGVVPQDAQHQGDSQPGQDR